MRRARRVGTAAMVPALMKHGSGLIADGFRLGVPSPNISANRMWVAMSLSQSRPSTRIAPKCQLGVFKRGRGKLAALAVNDDEAGNNDVVFLEEGAEEIAERLAGGAGDGIGVFYNRVSAINRDLSVLMANVLAEERLKERSLKKKRTRPTNTETANDPSGAAEAGAISGCAGAAALGGNGVEDKDEDEGGGLVVLDAFAASGVRALRYLTEVPGVGRVVANDHDATAICLTRQAADLCGMGDELETRHGDALDAMYGARAGGLGTYDVIDIDPFGESAPFLDASVQAVNDGGLLCITSTDMPALSGAQPDVAYARYGSVPTRSGYHHEMSLRILLHATSAAAGRHRRSIEPVLSVAIDHYVRVFVRVFRSPKAALVAARKSSSYVLQSEDCPSFFLLPVVPAQSSRRPKNPPRLSSPNEIPNKAAPGSSKPTTCHGEDKAAGGVPIATPVPLAGSPPPLGGGCPETGGEMKVGGPIWSGPLHDKAWVARAIALASADEELDMDGACEKEEGGYRAVGVPSIDLSGAPSSLGTEGPRVRRAARGETRLPRLAAGARVESLLRAVSRELDDVPLFYNLREVFATMGLARHPQREQLMGALEAAGYRTSGMHKEPLALKTDAPDAAVWDVLRCWVRDNPQPPPVRAAGRAIIARGPQVIANANFAVGQVGLESRDGEGARGRGDFLHAHNPEGRWGPLARRSVMAGAAAVARGEDEEEEEEKEEQDAKRPTVLLPG